MITSKRSMQLGGKTIPLPNPQGRLKVAESVNVTVTGSVQVLAAGAVAFLNGNFGAFQLPKNALLKKVLVTGNITPIGTGIAAAVTMSFNLGASPNVFYKPPVSTLTALFDLALFKSVNEGMIDTSFDDDPVFIPANQSIQPSCQATGSFVLNDQFNAQMYLFFTML